MNRPGASACEGLIDYVVGLGSDVERKRFERHLASCRTCKEEAANWRDVWERLSEDVELVDPPADLKAEVLDSVLREPTKPATAPIARPKPRPWRNASVVACALLLAAAAFLAGRLTGETETRTANAAAATTTIDSLFRLTAQQESGLFADRDRAYGVACFVRAGKDERLVVYLFDAPATKGSEAYQVWLWRGDRRTSAGTLTVGDAGIGILTLPVKDGYDTVDAVGVTLEPDPHSAAPRGPKAFGSEGPVYGGEA